MRTIQHKLHQPKFGSAIGAGLGIVAGLLFFFAIFGERLDELSFDIPFRYFRGPGKCEDVVIIKLDDATYTQLQQNAYAFDGSLHARLIRRLKDEGAALIVFDILFIDQNPAPKGDAELAAAMKEHGKIVIGGNFEEKSGTHSPVPLRAAIEEAAAGWGLVTINVSPDSTVRQHYSGSEKIPMTRIIPSLAWKAAEIAKAEVTLDPRNRLRDRWLNFYGPEPFLSVPYYQAVDPTFKFPVPLKDKAVFVGRAETAGYAGAEKDEFSYPWTGLKKDKQTRFGAPFGVEFHALAFANLMRGDWLRSLPFAVELLLIVAVGGTLGWTLPNLKPIASAAVAVGAALLITTIACILQLSANVWFTWMIPVAIQIPLILVWAVLFHSIRSYFEVEFLSRSLSLYVSSGQVAELLKQPELLKPGVQQREVSILFSDIASFSKISERLHPEDLATLLNDYYETAIACVHETGGTVMNLIGDAILAIWNAPQEQSDHRERACRAATLLAQKLIAFDVSRQTLQLRTRVGLHTGVASVGNIGSSSKFNYTVIGENVNLASRLEGLNKYLGTSILATREVQRRVEKEIPNRLVGYFRFKGLDQVVEVYELIAAEELKANDGRWIEEFRAAIYCFQRKSFEDAKKHFNTVVAMRKSDGPSDFYLKKITEFEKTSPGAEWIGEIDLSEK